MVTVNAMNSQHAPHYSQCSSPDHDPCRTPDPIVIRYALGQADKTIVHSRQNWLSWRCVWCRIASLYHIVLNRRRQGALEETRSVRVYREKSGDAALSDVLGGSSH